MLQQVQEAKKIMPFEHSWVGLPYHALVEEDNHRQDILLGSPPNQTHNAFYIVCAGNNLNHTNHK